MKRKLSWQLSQPSVFVARIIVTRNVVETQNGPLWVWVAVGMCCLPQMKFFPGRPRNLWAINATHNNSTAQVFPFLASMSVFVPVSTFSARKNSASFQLAVYMPCITHQWKPYSTRTAREPDIDMRHIVRWWHMMKQMPDIVCPNYRSNPSLLQYWIVCSEGVCLHSLRFKIWNIRMQ